MRKFFIVIFFVFVNNLPVPACDLCKRNQPEILEDVTHGPGPQGKWDYVIICAAMVIVAITLFYSIKYLVKPREDDPDHIKNIVTEL